MTEDTEALVSLRPRPAIGPIHRQLTATWPRTVACYLLLASIICFHGLGSIGIISMEGMVIDGARHMIESGDWIVPHVYGEMYTYKPALAYWLSAAAIAVAGDGATELALRLPFALFVTLCGGLVMVIVGVHFGRRAGLLTALALQGTVLFTEKIRIAEFDSVLSAALGVAVVSAAVNLALPRPTASLWLLAYAGLALGFLTKGTPALIAYVPGLALAAWGTHRLPELIAPRHLGAFGVFVSVVGIYLGTAYVTTAGEAFVQPLQEADARGLRWTGRAVLITLTKPILVLVAFLP